MSFHESLATGFDSVEIDYDPTIWSPLEIVEREKDSYRIVEPEDPEVKQDILETVEEAKGRAREEGTEFYNGPLIRVKNHELHGDTLYLDIQNTNYFSHAGTRKNPGLSKQNRADPLSVGARLVTSDNYVVLGEKSGWTDTGTGEYQLPGAGFIEDPELQYQRSLNAQASSPIHRELEEELNLDYTQMTVPVPAELVGAVSRQPMLVYEAETTLDSSEVIDEWTDIPEAEREFSELMFVPEDGVEGLLTGDVSPDVTGGKDNYEMTSVDEYELRPHARGVFQNY